MNPWRKRRLRPRGQSIVEFVLMLPILLILLSGLFEFGFIFNQYLAVLDAARNASRFSSDNDAFNRDTIERCSGAGATKDFYRQAACLAIEELALEQPTVTLCLPTSPAGNHCTPTDFDTLDDVIVSVFSVTKKGCPSVCPEVKRFPDFGSTTATDMGWSYAVDLRDHASQANQSASRSGMHVSSFTAAQITSQIRINAPNTGFVLVEIQYHYWQMLGLPWFTQFVGNPIPFHVYALWPLSSAEPTSTS
jgi:Flp pilus assembly protein TadG